jgi:dihydroneopterin aldolase
MGLIQIENMEFYAYHGHFKEEQIVGNRFLVDLTIETDMQVPAKSDDLKDALNYQVAYNVVKEEMQSKSHLLEHIAGRILDSLYDNFTPHESYLPFTSAQKPTRYHLYIDSPSRST